MKSEPVISVIIPCYNHGHYLPEAVESALGQNYPALEVIVVDDGSVDSTREVAARYPDVKYVYQRNSGLSAARNTGIRHSTGAYLVFLDADDWLYPGALEANLRYLQQHPNMAFVSGAYDNVWVCKDIVEEVMRHVPNDHYCHLLRGNYVGMIAAVLFQRWAMEEFKFDKSLRACEDYDLYLRVARIHPVGYHASKIAGYRFHAENMSANIANMLESVTAVLRRQKSQLKSPAEKKAYKQGQALWANYYCKKLYKSLLSTKAGMTTSDFRTLAKYSPQLILKYFFTSRYRLLKSRLRLRFYTANQS